jgi:hypothetical protein
MKDWLLSGAIETDEKMATDLAGPGYHINRSNLLVLESKADMQKHGQARPDDGDALALTFAQAVAPAKSTTAKTKRYSAGEGAHSPERSSRGLPARFHEPRASRVQISRCGRTTWVA